MGVEFDEEGGGNLSGMPTSGHGQDFMSQRGIEPRPSALVRLVMKLHLAKDEHGANIVFVVVTILALLLAGLVTAYQFGLLNTVIGTRHSKIQYKEDIPDSIKESLPPGFYDSLPSRPK